MLSFDTLQQNWMHSSKLKVSRKKNKPTHPNSRRGLS